MKLDGDRLCSLNSANLRKNASRARRRKGELEVKPFDSISFRAFFDSGPGTKHLF